MKQKRGFTLIELLVVISIISLLSSIVIASLSSAKGKALDAKRVAEVKQLETAFFMIADKNGGVYPASGGSARCLGTVSTCWGGGLSGSTIIESELSEFMPNIPKDPANRSGKGDRYLYSDGASNIAQFCNGGLPYPTGPFIYYVPEVTQPTLQSHCAIGVPGCCGNQFSCANGNACVYPLK